MVKAPRIKKKTSFSVLAVMMTDFVEMAVMMKTGRCTDGSIVRIQETCKKEVTSTEVERSCAGVGTGRKSVDCYAEMLSCWLSWV